MAKPDYETLLGQIAAETDPTAKACIGSTMFCFSRTID